MKAVRSTTILCSALFIIKCDSFAPNKGHLPQSTTTSLSVFGSSQKSNAQSLSPLPRGISPFEKSLSKNLDIQAEFRQRAKKAIDAASADNVKLLEIEFPPVSFCTDNSLRTTFIHSQQNCSFGYA